MTLKSVTVTTLTTFALFCGASARAQVETISVSVTHTASDVNQSWTTLYPLLAAQKVEVVTLARPKRRQNCRVASIAADQIACSRRFGGPVLYRKRDVVALIEPATRDPGRLVIPIVFGSGVGAIVLAIFLPGVTLGAAIPLEVLGSLLILASGAMGIGDNYDPKPAHLLFLTPGAQLQVALK